MIKKLIILFSLFFNNNLLCIASNNKNQLKICTMLHLYNLNLIDEFISRINYFIKKNFRHDHFIKINIPIDRNIDNAIKIFDNNENLTIEEVFKKLNTMCPYHKNLINVHNAYKLYNISEYLKRRLDIDKSKIQIIFSENRGVDIGGFFLSLNEMAKENLKFDFIVKIHTKSERIARESLLSILYLDLDEISDIDYFYTSRHFVNLEEPNSRDFWIQFINLLKHYKLPEKSCYYCGGTMFIVSYKIMDFFRNYNLLEIFNSLTKGPWNFTWPEYSYECFFGYLGEFLNLKTKTVSSIERPTDFELKQA